MNESALLAAHGLDPATVRPSETPYDASPVDQVAPASVPPDPDPPRSHSDDDAPRVVPGYCAEHRGTRLVTHRRAGERVGTLEDPATVCPSHIAAGDYSDRERCRWCGGPLRPSNVAPWFTHPRRAYCCPNHRLRAHRAANRRDP